MLAHPNMNQFKRILSLPHAQKNCSRKGVCHGLSPHSFSQITLSSEETCRHCSKRPRKWKNKKMIGWGRGVASTWNDFLNLSFFLLHRKGKEKLWRKRKGIIEANAQFQWISCSIRYCPTSQANIFGSIPFVDGGFDGGAGTVRNFLLPGLPGSVEAKSICTFYLRTLEQGQGHPSMTLRGARNVAINNLWKVTWSNSWTHTETWFRVPPHDRSGFL